MTTTLLLIAAVLQGVAVAYGLVLRSRRRAVGAWTFLLGGMLSMLAWRLVVVVDIEPPAFFNPVIAIWGSTCMVIAMFLFAQEGARREQAEAERDALLASERQARADAEHSSRIKDEFLGTLSHELRTPLASILGWCTLLRVKRQEPGDLDRAVDTIERNARIQVRLVDDLLDATRIQAGKMVLERTVVPLEEAVRTAVEASRPAAEAKAITVVLDVPAQPVLVAGDPARLQQIATNLLTNAVKFTPAGGRVRVAISAVGDEARLVVDDTGEGISPDFLPHIFTRFRQADSSSTRRHGGLGLGLAIVASLVELHGGKVSAASDGPGRGATFTVTLPLAVNLPRETSGASAAATGLGADALAGLRVLVVDDDADVRAMVARLLSEECADVALLDSGVGIAERLREFRPHVLLIDIGMPGEDGYAVMRRIRALPAADGGDTPAISLTAHAREEDRRRAIDSGFQDHLPKPIDVPVLVARLAALGGPRRSKPVIAVPLVR